MHEGLSCQNLVLLSLTGRLLVFLIKSGIFFKKFLSKNKLNLKWLFIPFFFKKINENVINVLRFGIFCEIYEISFTFNKVYDCQ